MVDQAIEPKSTSAETDAWLKMAQLVLSAASDGAVDCGGALDALRQRVQESLAIFSEQPSASQIHIAAGALAQAFTRYHEENRAYIESLRSRSAEPRISQATIPAQTGMLDSCTGLPMRADAEAAIQKAIGEHTGEGQVYLAVFYLHRMQLVNARFGETIGNQIILFCSQHIASTLTHANDALFRWTGPAFVAILTREESQVTVHNEVQRLISMPLSRFFETPSRTVYLPVKLAGEAVPTAGRTYVEIADQIDQFILAASGSASFPQK